MTQSPLFGLTLTLGAYEIARWLGRRTNHASWANPVLVSIVIVGSVLTIGRIDYEDYMAGGRLLHLALGTATVALAVPLARRLPRLAAVMVPVFGALLIGSVTAIAVVILTARGLGATPEVVASLAPKSATTAVSVGIAERLGGIPSLTAVATIVTGIVGAVAGPAVARRVGGRDDRVLGVALGAMSHGIGTARAFESGEQAGAFAGVCFAVNAVVTAAATPLLLHLLG